MIEQPEHAIAVEHPQNFLSETRIQTLLADTQEQLTEEEQQIFLSILEKRLSTQTPYELRALYIFMEGLQFCLRQNLSVMKELALMEATGGMVDLVWAERKSYDFADVNPVLSPYRKEQEMQRAIPHRHYLNNFAKRWDDKDSDLHKGPGKTLPMVCTDGKLFCYQGGSWRSSVTAAKIDPYDDWDALDSKNSAIHRMNSLRSAALKEVNIVIDGVSRKLRDIAFVRVDGGSATIEFLRTFVQGTKEETLGLTHIEEKAFEIGCSIKLLLKEEVL